MNIDRIDHVEFHVADAPAAAAELADAFGFQLGGHPGQAALPAGRQAVQLRQGGIRLLLSSSDRADDPAAEFVSRHGDGVAVLALSCPDATAAFRQAVAAGAAPLAGPATHLEDGHEVVTAAVQGFGDVALRFVQRAGESAATASAGLLAELDHVAICVPAGELKSSVALMEQALGLRPIFHEYIEVGTQAMDSTVVQSDSGGVTFTLIEPDTSRSPGQIDGFLASHHGVGVQHLAFRTDDIARAVETYQRAGVRFLTTPGAYYDLLGERLGECEIPLETLRRLNILVDRDHGGQLFQIFTSSIHPRRTFFLEVIDRRGATTFGAANIKALYEAVERTAAPS
ncbi:4-hydroxyphenylpyruvate dioxygenase [Kitasatospora sp. NBC_01287]|uniref:4-hydroxyphenylpyruvate dioxygenase n=1 Tax=Kitasatospora sp. NBC_01287 TaxID=2903573 RepID=UPI0022512D12|nr:4-hydroxyphenylpyruvate dioxygenase [Kitasatospora sp. NBC_01287]MCX4744824.1 4-hydroxyphenylpyruvate dioxygenase [Kitasatospora sp. NBC_01287]